MSNVHQNVGENTNTLREKKGCVIWRISCTPEGKIMGKLEAGGKAMEEKLQNERVCGRKKGGKKEIFEFFKTKTNIVIRLRHMNYI